MTESVFLFLFFFLVIFVQRCEITSLPQCRSALLSRGGLSDWSLAVLPRTCSKRDVSLTRGGESVE